MSATATTTRWIVVPNWADFQHYRDRDPKWIKVYNSLLHKSEYLDLSAHRRAVLHGVWLLYASSNAELRLDTRSLSRRLSIRVSTSDVDTLEAGGWIELKDAPEPIKSDWASRYISDELRAAVLERDGHKCRLCGSTETLEIDHIRPISKGGTSEMENLQTLCRPCNRRKHNGASVPDLSSSGLSPVYLETEREKKGLTRAKATAKPGMIRCDLCGFDYTPEHLEAHRFRAHGIDPLAA